MEIDLLRNEYLSGFKIYEQERSLNIHLIKEMNREGSASGRKGANEQENESALAQRLSLIEARSLLQAELAAFHFDRSRCLLLVKAVACCSLAVY